VNVDRSTLVVAATEGWIARASEIDAARGNDASAHHRADAFVIGTVAGPRALADARLLNAPHKAHADDQISERCDDIAASTSA
jgi:hypothetical protein